MEANSQLHAPVSYSPGSNCKKPADGNQSRSGRCVTEKNPLLCPEIEPEGRGLETGECIFSTYLILPAAIGPGIYSASNEMSIRSIQITFLGNRARPVRKADILTTICEPIV
jgi:hypothetical protein